jgi:hypothetical protein
MAVLNKYFEEIDVVRVSLGEKPDSPFKTLVLPDPGVINDGSPNGFNFNRILTQLQHGSASVEGEYLLIMRADLELKSGNFIEKQRRKKNDDSILSERLVTTSIYFKTRHFSKGFRRSIPASFHPSDWIWFGLRDDVLKIYKGLEPVDAEIALSNSCSSGVQTPYRDLYAFRYPCEMLFGLNLSGYPKKHCFLDYTSDDREYWLRFCKSNLVILSPNRFSFYKLTEGHQAAVKYPFLEPTVILGTTNSIRLGIRGMAWKVFGD